LAHRAYYLERLPVTLLRVIYFLIVAGSALLSAWNAVHVRAQRDELGKVNRRLIQVDNWRLNRKVRGDDSELEELRARLEQLEHKAAGRSPQE
jgi:hypothetical protein